MPVSEPPGAHPVATAAWRIRGGLDPTALRRALGAATPKGVAAPAVTTMEFVPGADVGQEAQEAAERDAAAASSSGAPGLVLSVLRCGAEQVLVVTACGPGSSRAAVREWSERLLRAAASGQATAMPPPWTASQGSASGPYGPLAAPPGRIGGRVAPGWSVGPVLADLPAESGTESADRWSAQLPDVLVAAVSVVVGRYLECTDVVLTVETAATAPAGAVEVPVRVRWSPGDRFGTVVAAVRAERLSAGFATPPVDAFAPAPCGVSLRFTPPPESWQLAGVQVEPVSVPDPWHGHGLCVEAGFGPEGVVLRAGHHSAVLSTLDVERLLARTLQVYATAHPEQSVADLPMLTDKERIHVLEAWQGEQTAWPQTTLHALIERWARTRPDHLALVAGDEQVTYGELDSRANHAAHLLRRAGAGPESVVAVLAPRSAAAVIGQLSVLKAGAAFLPVDPAYPPDRVRVMLRDAGVSLAIGRGPDLKTLAAVGGLHTVVDLADVPATPVDPPSVETGPGNLAYVIYTSGSTGRPKGVAVSHRSIVCTNQARFAHGAGPEYDLLTLPLVFDGSLSGMLWTLTGGGCVVMATEKEVHDPRLLLRLADRWPITHLHTIASVYSLILEAQRPGQLAALRYISVGGEVLQPSLVARHFAERPDAALVNDYGPTETSVWATAHCCRPADAHAHRVPIGRPVPNACVYVLDDGLDLVPPGLWGEVFIGGPGVGRGYLNRPVLTAERFLSDPFRGGGARMYRTGDRARHLPDGTIELSGRLDRQVKIRGFRVELGEIENVIARCPGVRETAVVLTSPPAGTSRLVAFVVGDAPLTVDQLRQSVADGLPRHMHPDTYTVLPTLPRNGSGKVDLNALLRGPSAAVPVPNVPRAG